MFFNIESSQARANHCIELTWLLFFVESNQSHQDHQFIISFLIKMSHNQCEMIVLLSDCSQVGQIMWKPESEGAQPAQSSATEDEEDLFAAYDYGY